MCDPRIGQSHFAVFRSRTPYSSEKAGSGPTYELHKFVASDSGFRSDPGALSCPRIDTYRPTENAVYSEKLSQKKTTEMRLTEMKQILDSGQIRLTKSLGQNFLHDLNQLHRIVAAAELSADDCVLEIGPGLGPLTQIMLKSGCEVLAIEIDRRLFEYLQTQFKGENRLTLIHADALAYLRENRRDWSKWKLVANLPYSVGSPILVELAQAVDPPARMVVTVQIEVAHRLMAQAGSDDYGLLTLLVQARFEPVGWFKIPANCFFPAPEVDSACVSLIRRSTPLLAQRQGGTFERIVKRSFSQRRKMMLKLLKADWPEPDLQRHFSELGLAPDVRAEKVTLDQFVQLTRRLDPANDHIA